MFMDFWNDSLNLGNKKTPLQGLSAGFTRLQQMKKKKRKTKRKRTLKQNRKITFPSTINWDVQVRYLDFTKTYERLFCVLVFDRFSRQILARARFVLNTMTPSNVQPVDAFPAETDNKLYQVSLLSSLQHSVSEVIPSEVLHYRSAVRFIGLLELLWHGPEPKVLAWMLQWQTTHAGTFFVCAFVKVCVGVLMCMCV